MAIKATVRWSDSSWKPGESATLTYDVVAGTPAEAVAACATQAGSSFEFDSSLYAEQPTVSRPGFGLYRVNFNFKYGDDPKGGEQDPLKQPPTFRWRVQTSSEQISRDIHGNPFNNTAGDLFSSFPSADRTGLFLTITQNEKQYDVKKALQFTNTVNKGKFAALGVSAWSVDEGQCRCLGISQGADATLKSKFVPISYDFEFRKDKFPLRILSAGRRAYYAKDGKAKLGKITTGGLNDPVSDDVCLDAKGAPIPFEAGYKVDGQTYVASPKKVPDNVKTEAAKDGSVFLLFDAYEPISFAALIPPRGVAISGSSLQSVFLNAIANARGKA